MASKKKLNKRITRLEEIVNVDTVVLDRLNFFMHDQPRLRLGILTQEITRSSYKTARMAFIEYVRGLYPDLDLSDECWVISFELVRAPTVNDPQVAEPPLTSGVESSTKGANDE